MTEHECSQCRHMKSLEDNNKREIYFCMFDQSPCYLEETGFCGRCELDGYAEKLYQRYEEENDGWMN